MITPKDIENKTMSPEKRKSAKNDYFAFYVGRPLSYIYHSNYYWICTYVYWNHKDNADCRMVNVFPVESSRRSRWKHCKI